jgi:hypothetical protein
MKTDYFEHLENPFLLDIEDKETYDFQDYLQIQEKLQEKNLDAFLESLYPEETMRTPLDEMKRRTCKGIRQQIIDLSSNEVPTIQLFKVGNGGDSKNCIICCKPLFVNRYDSSESILQSLEEVGFNGHFMLLAGGFPNPTGTEMKYAGVPYSFKIFMMLEAKKRGFEKVLWIDSVCSPLNNPEPLFELLERDDAIFRAFSPNYFAPDTCKNIVFPRTIELLSQIVQRDIRNDTNVNSIVFGMNLMSSKMIQFIEEYYEMVKLGLPFLSCFPEEIVFTSLFNKPEYQYVFKNSHESHRLYIHELHLSKEDAKNHGYFFYQLHRC